MEEELNKITESIGKIIQDAVTDAVNKAVRNFIEPKKLQGVRQLAKYLDTNPASAHTMTKGIGFPIHRIGNKTFYYTDEIDKYLRSK
ncbi:MAG: hypothetical protein RR293_08575 [Bacteroidales bacterium]